MNSEECYALVGHVRKSGWEAHSENRQGTGWVVVVLEAVNSRYTEVAALDSPEDVQSWIAEWTDYDMDDEDFTPGAFPAAHLQRSLDL